MKTYVHIVEFFLEWEMFKTQFIHNIKAHTMFNKCFPENRAVYMIMRKTMVKPDRPQTGSKQACLGSAQRVKVNHPPPSPPINMQIT